MNKAIRTLVINDLTVPVRLAENQKCGGVKGQFRANVEISTNILTREGWVIEVEEFSDLVRAAFRTCGMIKATCEELADGVIHVANRQMRGRIVSAKVKVFNLTGYVETTWKAGDEIPAFPRMANADEVRRTEGGFRHHDEGLGRHERRVRAC